MKFSLGIKSDPIEYRYSYDWLFSLMNRNGIRDMQLGTFFELYVLPDGYFTDLRSRAEAAGIRIRSVFTAHRELGGFFTGDPHLERAARKNYDRLLEVAALLGASYVGSNPGAVYRDRPQDKEPGTARYLAHMRELSHRAKDLGLLGLTMEPMSCLAEPPSTPGEIDLMMGTLSEYHARNRGSTVPVYLCGDISHGLADENRTVVHDNVELFNHCLPWMCEFHFKNTDAIFGSTFGFGTEERKRGIVDIEEVLSIISRRASEWPVEEVTGYLEIGGPKLGRDYSDHLLESQLSESLAWIRRVMAEKTPV